MRAPRRVLGYARVSGAEQGRHGTSLDAQRAELASYCAARGWPAPDLYVEVESASAARLEARGELERLTRAAEPGDVVLVSALDRWSRDIPHAVASVRALVARGVGWISIRDAIDAATPAGDDMLGIRAWAADLERRRIRERTVLRRKALRDEGLYVEGLAPFGYALGPARRLVVVPADAALAHELYVLVPGRSLRGLSALMRERRPDRGWDPGGLRLMLRSRVYLGEVQTSTGAWVASHEPIVDADTWERAQMALDARRLSASVPRGSERTASWVLRGLARCALGEYKCAPTDAVQPSSARKSTGPLEIDLAEL